MPVLSVPDISFATYVRGVGVNTLHTLDVPDSVSDFAMAAPTLYAREDTSPDKGAPVLGHIPVKEGYEVRPVDDFSLVRYDGGVSKFRKDRQHSQPVWSVRAKFVFPTDSAYTYALSLMLSGTPFEVRLVLDSTYGIDTMYPGAPCLCWAVPESVRLGRAPYVGYEVSLELFAVRL